MREFKTAAKQAEDPEDVVKIKLDDVELISLRPTEGQMVMLMAAEASETRSGDSKVATTIDFALSIFDDESRRYLGRRLLDPTDSFGLGGGDDDDGENGAGLLDLIQAVVEEWSHRPTKPSSGSTSSPENGGSSSTDTASTEESSSSDSKSLTPVT